MQPPRIKQFLEQEFARVPEVETVFASTQGRTLHVWIVVDQFDRAVREKIYEREMSRSTSWTLSNSTSTSCHAADGI